MLKGSYNPSSCLSYLESLLCPLITTGSFDQNHTAFLKSQKTAIDEFYSAKKRQWPFETLKHLVGKLLLLLLPFSLL